MAENFPKITKRHQNSGPTITVDPKQDGQHTQTCITQTFHNETAENERQRVLEVSRKKDPLHTKKRR